MFNFDDDENYPAQQVTSPVVSVHGHIHVADFNAVGPHRFGGPLDLKFGGVFSRSPSIHRLITLALDDSRLGITMPGLKELPLVYGFTYEGCRLKYRVDAGQQIKIVEMEPSRPSRDWPYENYPAAFPEKRFAVRREGQISADQVHELAWQGITESDPADSIVVIVPPAEIYGVSLWGEQGDAEQVQVVFQIDPATRTVVVENQCT